MNQQRECRACSEMARGVASQDSRAGVQQGSCMTVSDLIKSEVSRLSGFDQHFATLGWLNHRQSQHQISLSWNTLVSDLFSQSKKWLTLIRFATHSGRCVD